VALVVTTANALPLPSADGKNEQLRLELLRDRALLATLYATGMRRQELSSLNRADIQDGRSFEGLITGKGDKERVVFFDAEALAAIRAYLATRADTYQPVFLRHDDGRGKPGPRGEHWRLSPQSVWGVVKKYGDLAGVEVTTHHLRHLKARVMLNNGAQLSEVQDILGHASPETTKKIYAPYTKQHLRDAFDRFSLSADEVARRVRQ
jgi:integrase/recombinase XerD